MIKLKQHWKYYLLPEYNLGTKSSLTSHIPLLLVSANFYPKTVHLHQFSLKNHIASVFYLMSSIVWILSSHWMLCSFPFYFPVLMWLVPPFPIPICYHSYIYSLRRSRITYEVGRTGFHVKEKWVKQRDLSYCLFLFIFQFLFKKKKNGARKIPTAD